MKKLIYISLIIFTALACSKFEEEISWDIDEHPDLLTVESILTNENKQQSVKLTLSHTYFDSVAPSAVRDAEVSIIEGDHFYTFSEDSEHPGLYISDLEFAGEPLKTYQLEVNLENAINGLTKYSAVSTMPEGIEMDSAWFHIYEMPEFDFEVEDEDEEKDTTILGIYFFGDEPKSEENYYLNKVYRNGKFLMENAKEYLIYNDDYRNGEYSHLSAFIYNIAPEDDIMFQVYSIEKGFFKFLEGIKNADQSGGMGSMSGPPANAIGNIDHGLGYFAAAYLSVQQGKAIDMRLK